MMSDDVCSACGMTHDLVPYCIVGPLAPPKHPMIAITPERIKALHSLVGQEGGAHPGWDALRAMLAEARGEES